MCFQFPSDSQSGSNLLKRQGFLGFSRLEKEQCVDCAVCENQVRSGVVTRKIVSHIRCSQLSQFVCLLTVVYQALRLADSGNLTTKVTRTTTLIASAPASQKCPKCSPDFLLKYDFPSSLMYFLHWTVQILLTLPSTASS